ncbi:MAG: hypothetical protein JXQ84_06440 [Rhodospirillaceae bacterium]|nr:hypothetical protein [Rhodospirillaceae bacterium]
MAPVNHDSVRDADPYAFDVAHRRLAWMFRLSVMMNVSLGVVVIVLASAISTLVPLKTTQIALLRIEPSTDRVVQVDPATRVRIEPITKNVKGFDLLMESFARRYVTLVKPMDTVSQASRMTEARGFSDKDFWETFAKERLTEYEAAVKTGLTRSVTIETAERLPTRGPKRLYAVDFTQTDHRSGKEKTSLALRAYLTVTTREQTVRDDERYENPLGIRVLGMSVQPRGKQ